MDYKLELKNASFSFFSDHLQNILKSFSFVFPKKGLVGIGGISGSGKSTLLNIISLKIPLSSGELSLNDINSSALTSEFKKEYLNSILSPHLSLVPSFTVIDNLVYFSASESLSYEENKKLVKEKLKSIIDDSFYNKKITELSSGMTMKVYFSLCYLRNYSILLLDEPTSHLDSKTKKEVIELMKTVSMSHLVIFASNDKETLDSSQSLLYYKDDDLIIERSSEYE